MEVVYCPRRPDFVFLRGERASTCAPDGGYRLVPPDVGARPHRPGPGSPDAHHGAPRPGPHRMSAPDPRGRAFLRRARLEVTTVAPSNTSHTAL